MKKLFEKIKKIRFWWLGIPVLVVVVGVVISAFGGGLLGAFKKKEEPEPFNYVTDDQAEDRADRIKDHRDSQNEKTGQTADDVRDELNDMLDGGGSSNG